VAPLLGDLRERPPLGAVADVQRLLSFATAKGGGAQASAGVPESLWPGALLAGRCSVKSCPSLPLKAIVSLRSAPAMSPSEASSFLLCGGCPGSWCTVMHLPMFCHTHRPGQRRQRHQRLGLRRHPEEAHSSGAGLFKAGGRRRRVRQCAAVSAAAGSSSTAGCQRVSSSAAAGGGRPGRRRSSSQGRSRGCGNLCPRQQAAQPAPQWLQTDAGRLVRSRCAVVLGLLAVQQPMSKTPHAARPEPLLSLSMQA